jgi:hypothetical protein
MALCIRISTYLYDKKTNKLRIRDFWEKLQEDQYFGDLEQQLLPILVKGVNNVKGLQGRER